MFIETSGSTDTLSIIGSSDRVGILTHTPSYPLDVTGDIRSSSYVHGTRFVADGDGDTYSYHPSADRWGVRTGGTLAVDVIEAASDYIDLNFRTNITSEENASVLSLETTNASYDNPTLDTIQDAIDTTDATPTVAWTYDPSADSHTSVSAQIVCQNATQAKYGYYHIEGLFYDNGGTTISQRGATTSITNIESDAGMDAAFTLSGSSVQITVTGTAATGTSTWSISAEVIEVN